MGLDVCSLRHATELHNFYGARVFGSAFLPRMCAGLQPKAVSGAPELSRCRRMIPSAHFHFEFDAKVFWLTGTRDVPHSPASPMTVVSFQGAYGSCGGYSEVGETLLCLR